MERHLWGAKTYAEAIKEATRIAKREGLALIRVSSNPPGSGTRWEDDRELGAYVMTVQSELVRPPWTGHFVPRSAL